MASLIGPLFIEDAGAYVAIPYLEPSWAHPFGTTGQGQDVLAQTIVGTRASLFSGLLIGLAVVALGAAVGVTAGYFGKLDRRRAHRWRSTCCWWCRRCRWRS